LEIFVASVTGKWGWATLPNDVRRAVIFLAQEYERAAETGSSGDLTGKSVAEVSEQYALTALNAPNATVIQGIPQRVADILWPYKRHSL
jgi:hypothetical protein